MIRLGLKIRILRHTVIRPTLNFCWLHSTMEMSEDWRPSSTSYLGIMQTNIAFLTLGQRCGSSDFCLLYPDLHLQVGLGSPNADPDPHHWERGVRFYRITGASAWAYMTLKKPEFEPGTAVSAVWCSTNEPPHLFLTFVCFLVYLLFAFVYIWGSPLSKDTPTDEEESNEKTLT